MNDYKLPKFICYKCGYHYFGDSNICPKCLANNSFPKFRGLLFLSMICFIFGCFLSGFKASGIIFICIGIMGTIIFIPFAINEAIKSKPKVKDGFIVPETVSDVLTEQVRMPNLVSLNYVDGLKFDTGIKKLTLDIAPDEILVYGSAMEELGNIKYDKIVDLKILEDEELKHSLGKGLVTGTLAGIAFGGLGGIIGYALGGVGSKTNYILQISFNVDNQNSGNIYLSGEKHEIQNVHNKIHEKLKT